MRWPPLILAVLLLAGCSAPMEQTGVRIGDETLKQFKAGSTSEGWLLALLGPPTGCAVVEGVANTRVLRYETVEQSVGALAMISGRSRQSVAVTYFIITDGVVTRFWADRAKESSVLGNPVETDPGMKKSS